MEYVALFVGFFLLLLVMLCCISLSGWGAGMNIVLAGLGIAALALLMIGIDYLWQSRRTGQERHSRFPWE